MLFFDARNIPLFNRAVGRRKTAVIALLGGIRRDESIGVIFRRVCCHAEHSGRNGGGEEDGDKFDQSILFHISFLVEFNLLSFMNIPKFIITNEIAFVKNNSLPMREKQKQRG